MKKTIFRATLGAMLTLLVAPIQAADMQPKPASAATIAAQTRARATMPVEDGQDEAFVKRGFIATLKDPVIRRADGTIVFDASKLDWIKGDAPLTVNPSVWRHMKLLKEHGLYKIADGVWQVRGLDPANMEIVSGKTGWIVIDPLMSTETAAAAMKLVNENLGERPVSAIIYGHSHPDHFGGVRAVVTPGTNPSIIAPEFLVEEAGSEFVIAGNAESRRSSFQFGTSLKPGPQGFIGSGIVTDSVKGGTITLIHPTDTIKRTGETRVIDGVTFEFQMVPETEAPSEMNFFLPEQKTLYVSEDTTCTMHNVQTPRGALVRDANKWAGFVTEQLGMWGGKVESLVTGHCWARFGNEAIKTYLELQRDDYKFIHDQTVRRLNNGETPLEIAENLKRPAAIENQWSSRGYYGTARHNAKGVYQRYVGWWDGIPAHLNLYPPTEQGKRYVKAMGGAKSIIKEAKRAMAEGDYRWSAEILNHVVFAEPGNADAKALLADSYEQMGYQVESAIWRNIYLVGAAELRGVTPAAIPINSPDMVGAMPMRSFLDLVATRLNPDKIGDRRMTLVIDDGVAANKSLVTLRNSLLVTEVGKAIDNPNVTVTGPRMALVGLFVRKMPFEKLEAAGLKISGDRIALLALLDSIETPPLDYAIVTP